MIEEELTGCKFLEEVKDFRWVVCISRIKSPWKNKVSFFYEQQSDPRSRKAREIEKIPLRFSSIGSVSPIPASRTRGIWGCSILFGMRGFTWRSGTIILTPGKNVRRGEKGEESLQPRPCIRIGSRTISSPTGASFWHIFTLSLSLTPSRKSRNIQRIILDKSLTVLI